MSDGGTFWLTTIDAYGHPHTRAVFAVIADTHLVVASSTTAAKMPHLRSGRPASIATSTNGLDIVWAGTPLPIRSPAELELASEAYRNTYGWDVHADPNTEALTAPYGAPDRRPAPIRGLPHRLTNRPCRRNQRDAHRTLHPLGLRVTRTPVPAMRSTNQSHETRTANDEVPDLLPKPSDGRDRRRMGTGRRRRPPGAG